MEYLTGVKPSPVGVNDDLARLARATSSGCALGPAQLRVSFSLLCANILGLYGGDE
jgi:hypothetical protein